MHCGLCLPTCPTYDATKLERNSPRGRIALMRAIADDKLDVTQAFGDEMYFCLGCLACMTACPAGVNYAELFEHARAEVEEKRVLASPKRDFIRGFTLRWLFMDLARLQLFGKALRLYQSLGLQTLLRWSGVLNLFPKRLRELEAMTPEVQPQFSAEMVSPITPAMGEKRFRVAVLTGCAQDLIFSDVNRDTVEVLARNGCEVVTPPEQHCCGSLHAHNGEWMLAQILARRNIDQFPPEKFDAIITNAGGCGSHLKHYAHVLAADPIYAARAAQWDAKVKDVHEWLAEIGIRAPTSACRRRREESSTDGNDPGRLLTSSPTGEIVTYHESCHLSHGQKVVLQPRELLRAIPGLKLVELFEASWCCGSAGIYNLTQPEMAGELLERKIKHIKTTGATVVATANPGCLLQIVNGAAAAGLKLRVAHPVTLLAEAYRAEDS
ncbi:MAG: (Fe-S)-binding protein [Pedosphaera sp.]|nr:(Fe-S)-binding protein [Pedosphaera sp.]